MQQLAGAVGVATLGTIFFGVAVHGDFSKALEQTLWVQVALLVAVLALSPLLPARAREPVLEGVGSDQAALSPVAA